MLTPEKDVRVFFFLIQKKCMATRNFLFYFHSITLNSFSAEWKRCESCKKATKLINVSKYNNNKWKKKLTRKNKCAGKLFKELTRHIQSTNTRNYFVEMATMFVCCATRVSCCNSFCRYKLETFRYRNTMKIHTTRFEFNENYAKMYAFFSLFRFSLWWNI